jgi:hypothetical protein
LAGEVGKADLGHAGSGKLRESGTGLGGCVEVVSGWDMLGTGTLHGKLVP